MRIQLSDHFTFKKLLRFSLPTIAMMIFSSVYAIVDGFFVSNFVGSTAFAAVNLIIPVLMIFSSIGFMVGTGGSALVSMTLGQGDEKKANEIFSLLVYFVIGAGAILMVIGYIVIEPVAAALGATPEMLSLAVSYARVSFLSLIPYMLQNMFQSFMITAEKPHLGFVITLCAGISNIVLDAVLVGACGFGVEGAAAATVIGEYIGGIVPLIYFLSKNNSNLRLGKCKFNGRAIAKACTNGSSELMTFISMSVVNMLYNAQLLKIAGEYGVAAFGVIMYLSTIAGGLYMGYSLGVAPIIGFNHGAQNRTELSGVFKKSLVIIACFSVGLTVAIEIFSGALSGIFVGYDAELMEMTKNAFRIYAISFLIMGFNMFASAFFTALNNGIVSAIISFARTLLFEIISILVLPGIFGINGVWSAVIVAECAAIVMTVGFWIGLRKKYGYAGGAGTNV